MKRSDINQPPCYFDRYINQVEDIELRDAFERSRSELEAFDLKTICEIGDAVYAEGKWTIKDIFQHLIDVEYILANRALRIARNDKTPLSGFDEELLAKNVDTGKRDLPGLVFELKKVRAATSLLFASFDDESLQRSGFASDIQMSVLAFGFTIVGHQIHHWKILAEKYLPLTGR